MKSMIASCSLREASEKAGLVFTGAFFVIKGVSVKKYLYRIYINKESKAKAYVYKYRQTEGIKIRVSNQSATIEYELSTLKNVSDFTNLKERIFKDAFRKVYFAHALKFDAGLKVNEIIVNIDGVIFQINKDNDTTGNFPFVFSMISNNKLGLNSEWYNIVPYLVETNKTSMDGEQRYSAVLSLLASKSREYEIDKFGNLWTAMNAYYKSITKRISDHHGLGLEDPKDANSIKLLASLIEKEVVMIPSVKDRKIMWKNNYVFERNIETLTKEGIEDLYDMSEQEIRNGRIPDKYMEIQTDAERFGVKTFNYILLVYAYRLRCDYFHGQVNTMLVAGFNDNKLKALMAVNYFLDRFLTENIPLLFDDKFEQMIQSDETKRLCISCFSLKKGI